MKKRFQIIIGGICSFLLVVLGGCQTYEMSAIEGRAVRNASVGFHGFAFEFPEGYVRSDPAKDKEARRFTYGLLAWNLIKDFERNVIGGELHEVIVFEKPSSRAISLAVITEHSGPDYSFLTDDQERRYMAIRSETIELDGGNLTSKDVEKIGQKWVSQTRWDYQIKDTNFVVVAYLIPGSLKDIYVLCGVSYHTDWDVLEEEMRELSRSLDLGRKE